MSDEASFIRQFGGAQLRFLLSTRDEALSPLYLPYRCDGSGEDRITTLGNPCDQKLRPILSLPRWLILSIGGSAALLSQYHTE